MIATKITIRKIPFSSHHLSANNGDRIARNKILLYNKKDRAVMFYSLLSLAISFDTGTHRTG